MSRSDPVRAALSRRGFMALESICGKLGKSAEWQTTGSRKHAAVVEDGQRAFV